MVLRQLNHDLSYYTCMRGCRYVHWYAEAPDNLMIWRSCLAYWGAVLMCGLSMVFTC